VQNGTGAGFFPARNGYGYECDGQEVFGSTASPGDMQLVMTNTRLQAFNMNGSNISPGPSGMPPDPMLALDFFFRVVIVP